MAFIKVNITVKGRVHGVGFRFYTQRMAKLIGVSGRVQNESDGSVSIVAVGTKEKIGDFLLTIKKGPSLAVVTDVDIKEEAVDYNEYRTFEIEIYKK